MSPAQGGEVRWMCLARWPAFVDRDVGVDVVVVAAAGVDRTPGEDAVSVAEADELPHPFGRVVLVDRGPGGEVEDRAEGDLGVAHPLLDLGQRGGAELLDRSHGRVVAV